MNKTPASTIQRGRGKGRDPWEIRKYLSSMGLTMADVAVRAETYRPVVSDTVNGIRNHARTLAVLESLGCPLELLYPLEAMQGEGRAA
jgi:trimethylamine:corrinoid methyltransferase-like protein